MENNCHYYYWCHCAVNLWKAGSYDIWEQNNYSCFELTHLEGEKAYYCNHPSYKLFSHIIKSSSSEKHWSCYKCNVLLGNGFPAFMWKPFAPTTHLNTAAEHVQPPQGLFQDVPGMLDQIVIWRIWRPSWHLELFVTFLRSFLSSVLWGGGGRLPSGSALATRGCAWSATVLW